MNINATGTSKSISALDESLEKLLSSLEEKYTLNGGESGIFDLPEPLLVKNTKALGSAVDRAFDSKQNKEPELGVRKLDKDITGIVTTFPNPDPNSTQPIKTVKK